MPDGPITVDPVTAIPDAAGHRSPTSTAVTDLAGALSVIEHLELALVSNRTISMAVGILMERHGVDATAAMAELRRTSSHLNIKLAQVALAVVEHRTPHPPAPASISPVALAPTPGHHGGEP